MDIRKGNDVNIYFEASKIGIVDTDKIKGIRCLFAKDVKSKLADVPVPASCNPSSYVIHDHMRPGYNVHMPYLNIDRHVHREFLVYHDCIPCDYNHHHCSWDCWNHHHHHCFTIVVSDYKVVLMERFGEIKTYIKVVFRGDRQVTGRYNIILGVALTDNEEHETITRYTFDYGHRFDITDQQDGKSGQIDIWIDEAEDEDIRRALAEEIQRAKDAEATKAEYTDISLYYDPQISLPTGLNIVYTYGEQGSVIVSYRYNHDGEDYILFHVNNSDDESLNTVVVFKKSTDGSFKYNTTYISESIPEWVKIAIGRPAINPHSVELIDLKDYKTPGSKVSSSNVFVYYGQPVEQTSVYSRGGGDTYFVAFCTSRYDDRDANSGRISHVLEYTYDSGELFFNNEYDKENIPDHIINVFNESISSQTTTNIFD